MDSRAHNIFKWSSRHHIVKRIRIIGLNKVFFNGNFSHGTDGRTNERARDHLDHSCEFKCEPRAGVLSNAMNNCYCIMLEVVPIGCYPTERGFRGLYVRVCL